MSDLAIIVPTFRREHLLQDLLNSIHATTEMSHTVYFMLEEKDAPSLRTITKLYGARQSIVGCYGSYVASANAGVAQTSEPYFLVANDDVLFRPGWDAAAFELMRDPIRVVGINQGNGRTDCFFLVARQYMVEHAGAFYHPEYRSQFCDTELADLARERGVWADAPDALIEHMHWTFGKSEMDENYGLAVAAFDHDRRLYEERRQRCAA